jgi:hypothetical protein
MLQLKDSLQIDERKEKMEDQEIILIFVFRSSWYPSLNKNGGGGFSAGRSRGDRQH